MTEDTMHAIRSAAWIPTTGAMWLYASMGYSSTPRFDMWFWGVSFWLDIIIFGVAVTTLALHR